MVLFNVAGIFVDLSQLCRDEKTLRPDKTIFESGHGPIICFR